MQPLVDAPRLDLRHVEALTRRRHLQAGAIMRDECVAMAGQDQTVIDRLTRRVIGAADL